MSPRAEPGVKSSHVLMLVNAGIFALMLKFDGFAGLTGFSTKTLVLFGADYGPLVREGQAQRLLTSNFIHIHAVHLLMNLSALGYIGPKIEARLGRARLLVVWMLSGIVGSLASVAWNWKAPVVSAGASGAVCGLIAAAAVVAHTDRATAMRNAMIQWGAGCLVLGAVIKADNAAHAGGLLAGAALGALMRRTRERPEKGIGLETFAALAIVAGAFGVTAKLREYAVTASELVNRGVELSRLDQHHDAEALYRRATELEPADAIAHYDLGLALGRLGDLDASVASLRRAYLLDPDAKHKEGLVLGILKRAQRHVREKRLAEALADANEAKGLAPDDVHARLQLVSVLIERNELDAAQLELEAAGRTGDDAQVKALTEYLVWKKQLRQAVPPAEEP